MKDGKYTICNIVPDEKFIDGAIECLNLYADKWDTQWIVCKNVSNELRYIQSYKDIIIKMSEDKILDYIVDNQFDAVILHGFGELSPSIIAKIPLDIKVFWFGWGYDIYNYPIQLPFLKWNLYKPKTKKFITPPLYKRVSRWVSNMIFFLLLKGRSYKKALRRIDYFAGIMSFEYDLLKQNLNFRAKKVAFGYLSLAELNAIEVDEKYNGNNILIGNSAALTNNHLDLLDYMTNIDLNDKKIILPLSYAGPRNYVEKVVESYKESFGNNVIALTDFMPKVEYNEYIKSCSAAVFFMERQQAMANINTALKYGCKVFLSEKNPVYPFYKDLGISIFSVEHDFTNKNLSTPLSDIEIEKNRAVLKNIRGYNAYIEKLNTIYRALSQV